VQSCLLADSTCRRPFQSLAETITSEPFTAPSCEATRSGIAEEALSRAPKSITDLAEQEGVPDAYVCRLLPLTCLAPDIVEAILDGRQPKGLRLAEVLGNGPLNWNEQGTNWGFSN
jgi:hypothetical protein